MAPKPSRVDRSGTGQYETGETGSLLVVTDDLVVDLVRIAVEQIPEDRPGDDGLGKRGRHGHESERKQHVGKRCVESEMIEPDKCDETHCRPAPQTDPVSTRERTFHSFQQSFAVRGRSCYSSWAFQALSANTIVRKDQIR